jgi:haloalkane dehalogenase
MSDRSLIPPIDEAPIPLFTAHSINQGQGSVYAKDYPGAAPAFVLMHGLTDNCKTYDDLIPYLVAGGRRVVAFDFLGFGRSDKPAGASYSFEQQRHDLHTVVDFLDLEEFVPVVHDSSGPAGVNFTIDNPDRVESLVVLNSPYGHAPSLRWPELIELFAAGTLNPLANAVAQAPAQFDWMLTWQSEQFRAHLPIAQRAHFSDFIALLIEENFRERPGARVAFGQMTAALNDEIVRGTRRYPELEAMDTSVEIIWGECDPYLNRGIAEELMSHLEGGRLNLLEAGHWLQADVPDQVAAIMLDSE